MGTSTKWEGPKGRWAAVGKQLRGELKPHVRQGSGGSGPPIVSRWLPPDKVEEYAQSFLETLEADLRNSPAAHGLVPAVHRAGERLAEVLAAMTNEGIASLGLSESLTSWGEPTPAERTDAFIARFTDQVAVSLGRPADAAIRRACVTTAERILEKAPRVRAVVEDGEDLVDWLTGELFCELYRLFFADVVRQFLRSVIAAKLSLAAPVLPFVDPSWALANRAAEMIEALIPTPCKESGRPAPVSLLLEAGRELAGEALERAFGLPSSEEAA